MGYPPGTANVFPSRPDFSTTLMEGTSLYPRGRSPPGITWIGCRLIFFFSAFPDYGILGWITRVLYPFLAPFHQGPRVFSVLPRVSLPPVLTNFYFLPSLPGNYVYSIRAEPSQAEHWSCFCDRSL